MANKSYKTNIDLRILGERIKFLFFVSNTVGNTTSHSYNKKKCMVIEYDTQIMVEAICLVTEIGERMFLRFRGDNLKIENTLNLFGLRKSDMFLEVFKNSKGVYGFESIRGNGVGAFLSHPNYFSTTIPKNNSRGVGALLPFENGVMGKNHSLQMVLPGANITKNISAGISFDMDIHIESGGQYIQSLGFKLYKENIIIIEGETLDVKNTKQIINTTPNISLETTYIPLTSNDLASRKVMYDYKKVLTPQNVDADSITLIESNVYTIQNPKNLNTNLDKLKLTKNNIIEIPYNISRVVEDGKIKTTKKVIKNGKEIYPLGWINELRDNEIVSSANKCISLKFNNREQLIAFSEKLKQQQIGNIETYPLMNTSAEGTNTVRGMKKTYSKISQWIERSTLDEYNDVKFSYDSDNYIKSILICPRKKTKVDNTNKGKQNGLYSDGTQYTRLNGEAYKGYFHIDSNLGPVTGKDSGEPRRQVLIGLYNYAPISANTSTDFYLSTVGKKNSGLYSAFTATTTDIYEADNTYDLHISASSFSAHSASTGTTTIPISNIDREVVLPMIGDINKQYKPYAFGEVYASNPNGSLGLNNDNPQHYMTYRVKSNGIYRFTYKAFLNVTYTDTKWCDYVSRLAPSGVTATTGIYPQNDYEIKRLINTSIIQGGVEETATTLQDTKFKLNTGPRYIKLADRKETDPPESGLLTFNFTTSLLKYRVGTGTTDSIISGTPTTLQTVKVLRSTEDGDANHYLTLDVNENDKFSNTYNTCITDGVSATTIFKRQIPIVIDTGLISLLEGEVIELAYDTNWVSTSKGNYFGGGGTTNVDINLGHKLDKHGNTIESPWYRGIKLSSAVVNKNLFFDQSKKSKEFQMNTSGNKQKIRLDGTLYLSDQKCGNILRPHINEECFGQQIFWDSTGVDGKLVWNETSTKPTNKWQKLIESNIIKDYQITTSPHNKLTEMEKDGVFSFHIPTYDSDYGVKCNFNFPQTTQSYIIVNKFKNYFGSDFRHYIVLTPECNFYKPCSETKLLSCYDILHRTRPDKWKIQNVGNKITINGKEIMIISDRSDANSKPTTLPNQTICKYFCDCGQSIAEDLEIDPIYGITDVFTDINGKDCNECVKNSRAHCAKIHAACKPIIIEDCSELKDYALSNEGDEESIPIKMKGMVDVGVGGGDSDGPGDPRGGSTYFSCIEGVCQEDDDGIYTSFSSCQESCEPTGPPTPPLGPDDGDDRGGDESYEEGDEEICKEGTYWCESRKACIPLNEKC